MTTKNAGAIAACEKGMGPGQAGSPPPARSAGVGTGQPGELVEYLCPNANALWPDARGGMKMNENQHQFLTLRQFPARLTAEQAAWVLNCQPHDIPALVAARLIKPLGNPPVNGIKFFATADILEQVKDRTWLVRMSATIYRHWQKKNARQRLVVRPPVPPLSFPPEGKVRLSDPASASG
jgi:hypothetical protein